MEKLNEVTTNIQKINTLYSQKIDDLNKFTEKKFNYIEKLLNNWDEKKIEALLEKVDLSNYSLKYCDLKDIESLDKIFNENKIEIIEELNEEINNLSTKLSFTIKEASAASIGTNQAGFGG